MPNLDIATLPIESPLDSDYVVGIRGAFAKRFPVSELKQTSAAATWGTITGDIADQADLAEVLDTIITSLNGKQTNVTPGTTAQYYRGDKTWQTLNKAAVGLTNVDNTSDADKPVSNATTTALSTKMTNPMTAPGDIIIGGTAGAATRLAKGTAEHVLTVDTTSGLPAWKPTSAPGLANPMTTAGDLIIGGVGGAPARLPKGTNTQFLRGDGVYAVPTSSVASNANAVFLDGIAGPQRTLDVVENRMPTVFHFGAVGTGRNVNTPLSTRYGTLAAAQAVYPFVTNLTDQIDWAALQAMCNWMQANARPVSLAGAKLNINRFVLMGAGYCRILGENAEIGGQLQAAGKISGTVAPDLTFPSPTTPGPMNGCVFYFPESIYYPFINNIQFFDLRFCICHYNDPNSPTYDNLYFGYCNVGVFGYQGMQTPTLNNCGGGALGVAYVSSATCFPAGSPKAGGDNYYTDGLKILNAVAGEFNSFGIERQPFFDAWFIASILRPTTDSVTINTTNKYTDKNGNIYTDVYTDPDGRPWPNGYFLNPTGRVFFVPYRTLRVCFTLTLIGVDTRGTVEYGYGICNTEINALEIRDVNYEGMFNYTGIVDKRPVILTLGSLVAGNVARQSQIGYIEGEHRLLSYTYRGISSGTGDGTTLNHSGTNPVQLKLTGGPDDIFDTGVIRDVHSMFKRRLPSPENAQYRPQGYADQNSPADFRVFTERASIISNNDSGRMTMFTMPRIFHLPYRTPDGVLRGSALMDFIIHFTGYMHVEVINNTTGEADYGIFRVSTDDNEIVTLAAPLANGDTQVTLTAPPSQGYNTPRFSHYAPVQADGATPITGPNANKGFNFESYAGANVIKPVNLITGLASTYPTGSKFRRSQILTAFRGFTTSMLTVVPAYTGGSLPFQGGSQLGLKNGAGASTSAGALLLDNLTVTVWFSHFAHLTA